MRRLVLLLTLLLPAPILAADVRIATLEWPPYLAPDLPGQGATATVVGTVFGKMGDKVVNQFMPFTRAVQTGTTDASFAGYYAEYPSAEVEQRCYLSKSIGTSPVGFVKRKGSGWNWTDVASLKGQTIGVVAGYVNDGAEFDAALQTGAIKGDEVADDLTNLRKVAGERIDAAVIDRNVFNFLISRAPNLATSLEFVERTLKVHTLHVCFARTPAGLAIRNRFDDALATIDIVAVERAWLDQNTR